MLFDDEGEESTSITVFEVVEINYYSILSLNILILLLFV